MSLASLFRRDPMADATQRLYAATMARARQPAFFDALGVADSLDGRFGVLALHLFLVLNRLKAEPQPRRDEADALGRRLSEAVVTGFDESLREMGTGDLSVGRKVKAMVRALYGGIAAFDAGLADGEAMAAALGRNIYPDGGGPVGALAALEAYIHAAAARLHAQPLDDFLAGTPDFGAAPHLSAP